MQSNQDDPIAPRWYEKTPVWVGVMLFLLIVPPAAVVTSVSTYCESPDDTGQSTSAATAGRNNIAVDEADRSSPIVKFLQALYQAESETRVAGRQGPYAFLCQLKFTEVLIALFTYWLAVVTCGLIYTGVRQETWLRRSFKAARLAANAAMVQARSSERAYLSSNRPQIRVRHVWAEGELWAGGQIAIKTQIVNIGVTTAIITEYSAATLLLRADAQLPPVPQYGSCASANATSLESGVSIDLPPIPEQMRPISDADNYSIRANMKRLYCFGYVRYEDAVGRPRTTAFCRVLEPPAGAGSSSETGRFVPLSKVNLDYEYQD